MAQNWSPALVQSLRRYEQVADTSDSHLTAIMKEALEIASQHQTKRHKWKSSLPITALDKIKTTDCSPLAVTQQEVTSLYMHAREKMNNKYNGPQDDGDIVMQSNENNSRLQQQQFASSAAPKPSGLHQPSFSLQHQNSLLSTHKQTLQTGHKRKLQAIDHHRGEAAPSVGHCQSRPQRSTLAAVAAAPPWGQAAGGAIPTAQLASHSHTKQDTARQAVVRPSRFEPVQRRQIHENNGPVASNSHQAGKTDAVNKSGPFRTARDELATQNIKKFGHAGAAAIQPSASKRNLGTRKATSASSKFVPPYKASEDETAAGYGGGVGADDSQESQDERLRNIDPKMVEMICNEIMYVGNPVEWDDIAGLEFVKTTIQEIVVWPLLRPDIFSGLRRPPKGILLFGPPGTGKTLIGKCIAAQSKSTFFSISASSLTSKWVGDGEKMVRALFAVARCHQPAVIFIDEIDSLLSQRCESEHESSRRIKTEFLVQLDGACTAEEERILVVGATNRPQELDEAARRRLVKRLYVPLPEAGARAQMVRHLMADQRCSLSDAQVEEVATLAEGFSGADMRDLCREAAYGPIRSIDLRHMEHIHADQVRPVTLEDFRVALQQVRPSVSPQDLHSYDLWNNTFGYGAS